MIDQSPRIQAILLKIREEKEQPRPDQQYLKSLVKQIQCLEDGLDITPEKPRRADAPAPRPRLAESAAEMAEVKRSPLQSGAAIEAGRLVKTVQPISDAELNRRLGWAEDDLLAVDDSQGKAAQMSALMIKLLGWVDTENPELTWKKVKVLRYVLSPHVYGGKSMSDLAADCGCERQSMDQFASALRSKFGIEPVVGHKPESRQNMARSKLEYHRKRKAPPGGTQTGLNETNEPKLINNTDVNNISESAA